MGREGYPKQDKLSRVILPASVYLSRASEKV